MNTLKNPSLIRHPDRVRNQGNSTRHLMSLLLALVGLISWITLPGYSSVRLAAHGHRYGDSRPGERLGRPLVRSRSIFRSESVLDPVLVYSTTGIGGSAIAVDSAGNAYVAGAGSVTKLNSTGTTVIYSYQLSHQVGIEDYGSVIAIDSAGNAYVGGFHGNSLQITKLNAAGTAEIYSLNFGKCGACGPVTPDEVFGITRIATDSAGNAYVTGYIDPALGSVGITGGAFQPNPSATGNNYDIFLLKLSADGSLIYNTYLPTDGDIVADSAGNAYIIGVCGSGTCGFPTTPRAFQPTHKGGQDAVIAKLNATGTKLIYSTYLGGSGDDSIVGAAIDSAGNAYLTGYTDSTDFPITPGAFQTTHKGGTCGEAPHFYPCRDAFVAKLNPSGTALVYSTYLGGSGDDSILGVVVDSAGNAYLTGDTDSTNFPTTSGAFQAIYSGGTCGQASHPYRCRDAVVAKLNATGASLVFSTYLGGSGNDFVSGIAVDSAGSAYVTGHTTSTDFPTTPGAFQPGSGSSRSFTAKINTTNTPCSESISPTSLSFDSGAGTGSVSVTAGGECRWIAYSNADWIGITSGGSSGNGSVSFSVEANSSTAPRTGTLTIAARAFTVIQAGLPVRITSASLTGKKLFVVGENFDPGAVILLNSEEQKTRNDDANPKTTLIGKKAGKRIKPGDTLQVRNPNGTISQEFTFTGS